MLVFLSRVHQDADDAKMTLIKIIIGQTIGFSVVILVSLSAMLLGLIIPTDYIDLVGFFPLYIGLHKAWEIHSHRSHHTPSESVFGLSLSYTELPQVDEMMTDAKDNQYEYEYDSYHNPKSTAVLQSGKHTKGDTNTSESICAEGIGPGDSGEEVEDFRPNCGPHPIGCGVSLSSSLTRRVLAIFMDPLVLEVRRRSLIQIVIRSFSLVTIISTLHLYSYLHCHLYS